MKLSLTFLALSAGALAQLQITDSVGASVLQVLATAIPPESISKATADPAAFSSELDSSLRAGETPSWYQALPSDVKSYLPQLYPASTPAETTSVASSTPVSTVISTAPVSTGASVSASPSGGNSTVISTVSSPTLSATGSETESATGAQSTGTDATGAAALPTAMVGSGIAGAMGILAMLAL